MYVTVNTIHRTVFRAIGGRGSCYLLCYPQAKDRIQYYQLDEVFVFPYDMGSQWKNFKQVFTWSGIPEGDGLAWPVRKDCHPYSLTVSISAQIGFPFYLALVSLSAP